MRRPPRSTLFPYAPLSRSNPAAINRDRRHPQARRRDEVALLRIARILDRDLAHAAPAQRRDQQTQPLRVAAADDDPRRRSEEHTSELQSRQYLVCRLLLEK